jgi:O-antigen ligase
VSTHQTVQQNLTPRPGQKQYYSALWWVFIVLVFISPTIIGSIGAVGALLPAFLAAPLLFSPSMRLLVRRQWGILVFPAVFIVLAVIFALNADQPSDMVFIFNFTALPLAVPAYVLARRFGGSDWPLIIVTLALVGTALGVLFGAFDIWVAGAKRAAGFANNPNMYAHVALLFGFIALSGAFMLKSRWRYLYLAGPFLGIAASILSGSRGTMLAVPVLVVVCALYLFTRPEGKKRVAGGLLAAILLSGAGLFWFAPSDGRLERAAGVQSIITEILQGGSATERGTKIRLAVYNGAWQAFLQSPIIGHGWAGAIPTAIKLSDRPRLARAASSFPHMHNDFLGFAAAAGLFGILSYFSMLAAPFSGLRRTDRFFAHRLYISALLVAAYIIYGFFDAPMGYDIGINTFVFVTAIVAGAFREPDGEQSGTGGA